MIDYKQPRIIEELRNRILDGTYTAQLPTTAELAAEFGVNIKTMGKAIGHLVEEGRLERRKRCGTRVKTVPAAEKSRLIEVVFEGFTTIFTHPFWRDIWGGLVEKLAESGYRPVLTMLTSSDPATGLLECDRVELYTEPYASGYVSGREKAVAPFVATAERARQCGLEVNAGHDLNLENLEFFIRSIPWTAEVSIGHAIICDALYMGLETAIHEYLKRTGTRA